MLVTDEMLLRRKSEAVEPGEDVTSLLDMMTRELHDKRHGVGLSAVQVGHLKRICIIKQVRLVDGVSRTEYLTFINPIIVSCVDSIVIPQEGCLAFPGIFVSTARFNRVIVHDDTQQEDRELVGMQAVILQHEVDHMDGVLMVDRIYKPVQVGRNAPCPCGSKKKYKKCCMKQ